MFETQRTEPYSFAIVQSGRYLAISLGTRESYPKEYDYRDMAGIRGRHGRSYFHLRGQLIFILKQIGFNRKY